MSRGEGERIKCEEGKRFLLLADQRCVKWVLPLLKVALNSLTFYSNIGYCLLLLPLLIYVFDGYSSFLYPWVLFIPSASPSLEDWQKNRHRKRWCVLLDLQPSDQSRKPSASFVPAIFLFKFKKAPLWLLSKLLVSSMQCSRGEGKQRLEWRGNWPIWGCQLER